MALHVVFEAVIDHDADPDLEALRGRLTAACEPDGTTVVIVFQANETNQED